MKILIIGRRTIKKFKWGLTFEKRCGQAVDDVGCSAKGINPKARRSVRMEKKSQTSFSHMMMFSFSATILGRSIWAR
jgi:hypothetical protein